MSYLHGIKIEELTEGSPTINVAKSSVIGLVGTAVKGELNKPILVSRPSQIKELFGSAGDEGATIPRALEAIFGQSSPLVVVVNVKNTEIETATAAEIAGTLAEGDGVYALLKAQSDIGLTPKILIAPNYASDTGVVTALKNVADKTRAVAIIEAGDENETVSEAKDLANSYSSSRLYPVYSYVNGTGDIGQMSLAPFAAGVMAENDFWISPSNKIISSIKSIANPAQWSLSDENSEANQLNELGVNTVVREGGFRLWGNRTLGKTDKIDIANKFINVRRTTDTINDSVVKSTLWALDQGITKNYIQEVLESISNFLRDLKSQGAIVNGKAFVLEDENTPDQLKEGRVVFNFDYTAVYPSEQLKFKSIITDRYLTEIFE